MAVSRTKKIATLVIVLGAMYVLLMVPMPAPEAPRDTQAKAFAWDRDAYWHSLEQRFASARQAGCDSLVDQIDFGLAVLERTSGRLQTSALPPDAAIFDTIQSTLFELGPLLAACPERLTEYIDAFGGIRRAVKEQSVQWDMSSPVARACLYRVLYGGRTAIEEVMMQAPENAVRDVIVESDEPSATPSSTILGATIHSGDVLVSRGGAPTSALIARGNDYPGNFSHIALVHVDPKTGEVSIIESHIEKGVAVATVDEYLRDTKLRVMVLRLRSDLPVMQTDPMLPHHAATFALARATSEHIPYDFAMDVADPSKLFCSEVAYDAYRSCGVELWSALSHISNPGARSWLAAFGVRHFTTHEPSDLEYDPQVRVVAEWRGFATLYQDRLDNAVVDVMLEQADSGAVLTYEQSKLPLARLAKAYSWVLNRFEAVGPVPEGMDASAALKNEWFSSRHHATRDRLKALAEQFAAERGYRPPYWELVRLAREAYASLPE